MTMYQPLPSTEDLRPEDTPKKRECCPHGNTTTRSWSSHRRLTVLLSVIILLLSINLLVATSPRYPTQRQCTEYTSVWSPAFDAVEYENYDFANDFGQKSRYRGPPSRAIEEAWNELIFSHAISIPENKLSSLNRTKTSSLKPAGRESYAALIEVFHQLHCLNRIRQYTWLQSGNYKPHDAKDIEKDEDIPVIPNDFRTSAVANRMHVDHCIETLRLTLMCHGDVTPMLIRWDSKSLLGERADFSTHHRCRNFDKIREWADNNVGIL